MTNKNLTIQHKQELADLRKEVESANTYMHDNEHIEQGEYRALMDFYEKAENRTMYLLEVIQNQNEKALQQQRESNNPIIIQDQKPSRESNIKTMLDSVDSGEEAYVIVGKRPSNQGQDKTIALLIAVMLFLFGTGILSLLVIFMTTYYK